MVLACPLFFVACVFVWFSSLIDADICRPIRALELAAGISIVGTGAWDAASRVAVEYTGGCEVAAVVSVLCLRACEVAAVVSV